MPSPERRRLVEAARALIAAACAGPASSFTVTIRLADGLRLVVPSESAPPEDGPADLSSLARRVLAVLTAEPQTSKALARAVGVTADSGTFYAALRELTNREPQLARKQGQGYRLA